MENRLTTDYTVPRGCPRITHLAFADDTIIFSNGSRKSLHNLMDFLSEYEEESGHVINKSKSCFLLGDNASASKVTTVVEITGYV